MFKSRRLNFTGKFLILSLSAYLVLAVISAYFFQYGLTENLDEHLQEIYELVVQRVIIEKDQSPSLPTMALLQIPNLELLPTVTLFDSKSKLLTQLGPPRTVILNRLGTSEQPFAKTRLRTLCRKVDNGKGSSIGYLQIQLSTANRDRAFNEFLEALYMTTPVMLLALSGIGYIFASRAIRPVEETFVLLRRFMSDAGHELKTPIAVIHASCDNLMADLEGNKAATDRVEVILRSADRMQRLVADLMLLTKSERANLALKFIPLRFDMLLREVLGEFGDLFEDKNIELFAESIVPAKVNGDKHALQRTLANLLENALNYTNAGGKVTVTLALSGSNLELKVTDSGVGIPADSIDKIFERFYRVDESRSRASAGAGLGLAIVKAIIESHNGQIAVFSELGKGTTFLITLPTVGQTSIFGKKLDLDEIPPRKK